MRSWGFRALVIVTLIAAFVAGPAPTAAAHDPDCLTSFHFGPIQIHQYCDGHRRDDSDCTAGVTILFIQQRVGCD